MEHRDFIEGLAAMREHRPLKTDTLERIKQHIADGVKRYQQEQQRAKEGK